MEGKLRFKYDAYGLIPCPILVAGLDGAGEWKIVYRNAQADALLASHPERAAALLDVLAAACADGTEPGEWRGVLWARHYHAKFSRCPDGVLAMLLDVTQEERRQRERIEAANAALQSALDAANAASQAKSDFLSHMSHDIRTPLNAIIGMTTIAQAHMDERERVADCLEKVSLSSRHLLGLINDILDMSRIESGKMTLSPEVFMIADFIHALMAVFRPQADQKHQNVKLDFTGVRHERIRGDELRIQQILINILSNAVKFTPEGGTISMRVRETDAVCRGEGRYAYYEFVIEDSGIGMSAEFLEKIFQPFERATGVGAIQGTGLGMTITRNLVEMMNGEISVSSEQGKGTRFTVTLPLELVDREDANLEELRGLRVLAAENDRAAQQHLEELLEELGMTCDMCGNAWAARDLAVRSLKKDKRYFAVLMDWRLPAVDGVQASRELREILGREIPIIVMSAEEWPLSADEMRKHGITAFLPKPLFRSRMTEMLTSYTPNGLVRRRNAQTAEPESFAGRRVLLVEDNELNREIGVEMLGMLDVETECAPDGKAAIERFRDSPQGTFDLIFMDLQMPVIDGFEATKAIRALPRPDSKTIPIVAMSANAFVEDIRACERVGMNDHVSKPVGMQQLTEALARHLGER